MVASTLLNPDFEEGNDATGQADDWTVTVATGSVFEVAGFDADRFGFETFDAGWGAIAVLDFLDSDLEDADFGGLPRDGFERQWGPFDGTDPNYATKVGSGFGDNTVFLTDLSLLEAASFDLVPENVENFETHWPAVAPVLDFVGIGTDLEASLFDTTNEPAEDFEEEWLSNENFIFDFVGIGTDLEVANFDDAAPQTVEDFEEVLDADEVFQVVTGIAGLWVIEINGVPYQFNSGVNNVTTIRNGLRDAINNGNQQIIASDLDADKVMIKNLSTQFTPLVVKGTAPASGDLERITGALAADFWLQPLLGF